MQADRFRAVESSIFGFSDNMMLVSYVPKKGKAVMCLSTSHHDVAVEPSITNKPHIILNYNEAKAAVYTLEKMCHPYTTKRGTRRWPISLFFTLLDIAAHNASVLWFAQHPDWENHSSSITKDRRRLFILEMGRQMCLPWTHERAQDSNHSTAVIGEESAVVHQHRSFKQTIFNRSFSETRTLSSVSPQQRHQKRQQVCRTLQLHLWTALGEDDVFPL